VVLRISRRCRPRSRNRRADRIPDDAAGDRSCTLYGSSFTFIGDDQTEDGGDTGGEHSPQPSEPHLAAYPPVADATASTIDWSGGGWPELVPRGCDLNRD
jgi:hypothetical protein